MYIQNALGLGVCSCLEQILVNVTAEQTKIVPSKTFSSKPYFDLTSHKQVKYAKALNYVSFSDVKVKANFFKI